MIDRSCVIIMKHLWKGLFSEGWALWARLDTVLKKYVCLTTDWKKDSKPYCHCKPFKSVWTPVKDTDFIFVHRPY